MRQVYRIDLSGSYYLRGHMYVPDHPGIEGKLLDLSARGASLVFLEGCDPGLKQGDSIELGFYMNGADSELRVTSVVRSRAIKGTYIRYGFEFSDYEDFHARVPLVLRGVFNRRRSPRVKPEQVVSVAIQGQSSAMDGNLVDISTCGMAVELPFHAVESFACGEDLVLEFTMTGQAAPSRLAAKVTDRRLAGPTVHLGVEFAETGGSEFDAAIGVIEDFVATHEVDSGCIPG